MSLMPYLRRRISNAPRDICKCYVSDAAHVTIPLNSLPLSHCKIFIGKKAMIQRAIQSAIGEASLPWRGYS
jgi:hypothetical protein